MTVAKSVTYNKKNDIMCLKKKPINYFDK